MSIVSRYTPPRRGAPGGKKWQLIILHYNSSLCYDKYAMTDGRHRTLLYPGIINRTKPARVLQATTEPVLSLKMYEHWSYFGGRYFGRQMSHAKFLSDR